MPQSAHPPRIPASPEQTAEYTRDMLGALHALAVERGQDNLAHLLAAAAKEARSLARPQRGKLEPASGEQS